jgi:hypothetical protein
MFINFSNHGSCGWSKAQIDKALEYGRIVDLHFPEVPADATSDYIKETASQYTNLILSKAPKAVMCQGEFTLTYATVSALKNHGITVLAACSDREVEEKTENGVTNKSIVFEFVQFREY